MGAEVQDQGSVENQSTQEPEKIDVSALQEKIKALESSLERVEGESKKHASKYRTLRDSVEEEKKKELEQSENWQKRFEMEREANEKLKADFEGLKENSLYQDLNYQVSKYAPDARKMERVVSAILDGKGLTVSENGMSFDGVPEAIELLRNEEEYLFKPKQPANMVNKNPSAKAPNSATSIKEMSAAQREIALKENIAAMLKTQTRR